MFMAHVPAQLMQHPDTFQSHHQGVGYDQKIQILIQPGNLLLLHMLLCIYIYDTGQIYVPVQCWFVE